MVKGRCRRWPSIPPSGTGFGDAETIIILVVILSLFADWAMSACSAEAVLDICLTSMDERGATSVLERAPLSVTFDLHQINLGCARWQPARASTIGM